MPQQKRELTEQQRVFVEEYLKNGRNATEAASFAFNTSSLESAAAMGHKLLKNPNVQAAIAKALGENTISDEEFWAQLRDILFNSTAQGARIRALELLADIKGLRKSKIKEIVKGTDDLSKILIERMKDVSEVSTKQPEIPEQSS